MNSDTPSLSSWLTVAAMMTAIASNFVGPSIYIIGGALLFASGGCALADIGKWGFQRISNRY